MIFVFVFLTYFTFCDKKVVFCLFLIHHLEVVIQSPFDSKEIKPVNLKGNQPWLLFGKTDAEAEAPILWPPDTSSQLIGKDPDAGKDWRQKEKRMTEDEMVAQHRQFSRQDLGQIPGDGEGQGSLVYCSPWGHKESDTTEQLNNNKILTIRKVNSI